MAEVRIKDGNSVSKICYTSYNGHVKTSSKKNGAIKGTPIKSTFEAELVGDKVRTTTEIYTKKKQSGQELMNQTVRRANTENDAFNRGMAWGGGITGISALPFIMSN